jgi:hypothetical protein
LNQQQGHNEEIEIRDQSGEAFTAVWNWLLDSQDLTGTEKLVWIALKSYAGYREIRPSIKTLSRRAGVSTRTAQRTLDALSKKNLLRVERRSRPDGGDATNRYILLPFPNRKIRRPGDMVTPAPGCHGDTPPGDKAAAPRMTPCHPKENIKLIKDKKTTGEVVVGLDSFRQLIINSPFRKLSEQSLRMFTRQYGADHVFDSLDKLIETYKITGKKIADPMGILAVGMLRGITAPAGYVPYRERIEKERATKEAAEQKRNLETQKRIAEQEAYSGEVALFDALPEQDRNAWLDRARAELPDTLKDLKYAVKSKAIELFRGG